MPKLLNFQEKNREKKCVLICDLQLDIGPFELISY